MVDYKKPSFPEVSIMFSRILIFRLFFWD